MRNYLLGFLILNIIISCGSYRETKDGYKIKGETKMIFNGTDNSLNEKCVISGFVYSRDTKDFPESANIQIGEIKTTTDKNGFFSVTLESGTYDISANFIGNNEGKLKNIEMKKNNRLIIMFELGTSAMY